MCTCTNGVALSGAGCHVNGAVKCASCNKGWTINEELTACIREFSFAIDFHLVFTTNHVTFTAAPSGCQVGDAVEAKYNLDGLFYRARIARIDGDTITINWNDGDPHGRHIARKDVLKNGVSCLPTTGTRAVPQPRIVKHAIAYAIHTYTFDGVMHVHSICEKNVARARSLHPMRHQ